MKNFYATSKKFSWPYPSGHRLLHSPSLVAVGLSVGWHYFLAATKQLYEWSFPSVCLSVRLSVTPF